MESVNFAQLKTIMSKIKTYIDDKIFTFIIKYRDSKNQLIEHKVDIGDEIDLSSGVYYATTSQTATRVSNPLSITIGEDTHTYNGSQPIDITISSSEMPDIIDKEVRFKAMPHFDKDIHLCNSGKVAGGTIYFGDNVDNNGNPYTYIREISDDTLEIKSSHVIINGTSFSSILDRLRALEEHIGIGCEDCDGNDCGCDGTECDCDEYDWCDCNGYCECDGTECDCDGTECNCVGEDCEDCVEYDCEDCYGSDEPDICDTECNCVGEDCEDCVEETPCVVVECDAICDGETCDMVCYCVEDYPGECGSIVCEGGYEEPCEDFDEYDSGSSY